MSYSAGRWRENVTGQLHVIDSEPGSIEGKNQTIAPSDLLVTGPICGFPSSSSCLLEQNVKDPTFILLTEHNVPGID